MIQHSLFAASVILVIASSGCCLPQAYQYHGCETGDCPSVESEVIHSHDSAGCVDCSGHRSEYHRHEKAWIHRTISKIMTCGAGCGEVYWSDWYNDPPDDCDPCNRHGDWTGPTCCPPRFRSNPFHFLWGQRHPNCEFGCEEPGCETCGGDGSFVAGKTPVNKQFTKQKIDETEIVEEELLTRVGSNPLEDAADEIVERISRNDQSATASKKPSNKRPIRRVHYTSRNPREH